QRDTVMVDIASLPEGSHKSSASPTQQLLSTIAPAIAAVKAPPSACRQLALPVSGRTPSSRTTLRPGSSVAKRSMSPHTLQTPARKQSKWSAEEDALIIELRGSGMKWDDISKHLPGRSVISCRLHYQNYLERRSEWDEERKNKLARLLKQDMWQRVAKELQVPWRAAEAMHWQLGEADMAIRAGVVPFSRNIATNVSQGPRGVPPTLHAHSQSHDFASLSPRYTAIPTSGQPQSSRGESLPPCLPSPRNRLLPPLIPTSDQPLPFRGESLPRRPPSPPDYGYIPGPASLVQTAPLGGDPGQPGAGRPGLLPSVAELTAGVRCYNLHNNWGEHERQK
ncbi:uncharacterized protein B0T15DRAFT_397702, partial [Chaetomium strumarium]